MGLTFKPETDDVRDSPSLLIAPSLVQKGAIVKVYDPVAMEEAKKTMASKMIFCKTAVDCIKGADALVILTEWNEFRALSLKDVKSNMNGNILIDLRNIYSRIDAEKEGFKYTCIGR